MEKCHSSNLLLRWIRQPAILGGMGREIGMKLTQGETLG